MATNWKTYEVSISDDHLWYSVESAYLTTVADQIQKEVFVFINWKNRKSSTIFLCSADVYQMELPKE